MHDTLGLGQIWKRLFGNVENITPECIGAVPSGFSVVLNDKLT